MLELLTSNHFEKILDLFDGTEREIKIISPFLALSMAEKLCAAVRDSGASCTLITRLYLEDLIARANSLDALELMMRQGIEICLVKRLHTKLYLFDTDHAILGSANFTNGGFKSNLELSLLISEEPRIIGELHGYFDGLVKRLRCEEGGRLTAAVLEEARQAYSALFYSKTKGGSTAVHSWKMYGAALDQKSRLARQADLEEEFARCKEEQDLVCTLFQEAERPEQIRYPFNIWLKFIGEGDNRLPPDQPFSVTAVTEGGRTLCLSNYSFRARSVKDGDEIYLAALTTNHDGRNLPVIVGRGHLAGFSHRNRVSDSMLRQHGWMEHYPWYCIIKDCEVLNAPVREGVSLDTVWTVLRSDTYLASFGRNEDIPTVARKHYQRAHIRLSGNAKQEIDRRLDQLIARFGALRYVSDPE